MINAGQFREPVVFTRKTERPDGMGGSTVTDLPILETFADVRIPSSRDGILAGRDVEIRSHLVTIRDGSPVGIQQDDHILWRGQTLIVRAVRPDLAHRTIQFDCVEYVGDNNGNTRGRAERGY